MKEMLAALEINLGNPYIDSVHLVQHDHIDLLPSSPKLATFRTQSNRLSIGEALKHANEQLIGETVIIANNDISFDQTLNHINGNKALRLLDQYTAFFLSRYEPESGKQIGIGTQCGPLYMGSHDAFIVKSPVPNRLVQELSSVFLGQPGADARFVWAARKHGLIVRNPCKSIRTLHHHRSGYRQTALAEANTLKRSDVAFPESIDEI